MTRTISCCCILLSSWSAMAFTTPILLRSSFGRSVLPDTITTPTHSFAKTKATVLFANNAAAPGETDADATNNNDFLTTQQTRARDIFSSFDADGSGTISSTELGDMLQALDIEASREEASALLKYLDTDGDGEIDFDEFLPWYSDAADGAQAVAFNFQTLILGRRTVDEFDDTPVSDDVLRRAIECGIAAPNRSNSEPWRFIQVGPQTVVKIAQLKNTMETSDGASSSLEWTKIPGWCVVTTKLSPEEPEIERDDFKSTSCAVQNFMLSMWSEGIGTKWTSGPVQKTTEFAKLCGVDLETERVVGCIWYGFATRGLTSADPKRRKKTVDDVLSSLP